MRILTTRPIPAGRNPRARPLRCIGGLLLLAALATSSASEDYASDGDAISDSLPALRAASSAVVLIISHNTSRYFVNYSEAANGILITADGYILTVSHGLSGTLPEVFAGEERYGARVVYNNRTFDLAILKINAGHPLPFVNLSGEFGLHQKIYLIGKRRRHRELFMSAGILNAKGINMSSKEISWVKTTIDEKKHVDYAVSRGILHSARFFAGLSGCPLFNDRGEVIGINTGLIGKEGQRITLALELICFLPVIREVTRQEVPVIDQSICQLDVDLKNPLERIGWILNGLAYYCSLLGKNTADLEKLRGTIEERAKRKIGEEHCSAREAIQWAWKVFLVESASLPSK